ncbi:MAG: hypothetical protein RL625_793 [Gemmatimonadota bacterium]
MKVANTAGAVVVVDDNQVNRQLAVDILHAAGFTVFEAASGPAALTLIERTMPDVVLMDVQMPGMSGFEVIAELRQHKDRRIATTTIIAITGLAMPGDREHCLNAGADDYLSRPVQLLTLVERVRTAARDSTRRDF